MYDVCVYMYVCVCVSLQLFKRKNCLPALQLLSLGTMAKCGTGQCGVPDAPLLSQLPAKVPEKVAEHGPHPSIPVPTWETQEKGRSWLQISPALAVVRHGE